MLHLTELAGSRMGAGSWYTMQATFHRSQQKLKKLPIAISIS